MSFLDSLFGSGGGDGGGGLSGGGSIWPAAIMAGSQLIGNLFADDGMSAAQEAASDLANRQFEYQKIQDAQELAAKLELARMQAGASGAAARAQVQAAGIAANAQKAATQQRAAEALMEGRLGAITATKPDLLTQSAIAASKARQAAGDASTTGFQGLAALLQRPMLQARSVR